MTEQLRLYLKWRFKVNNHSKYQKYCDEWINNIPLDQLWYYKIEMNHLINAGVYE